MIGVVGTAQVKIFDGFSLNVLHIKQEDLKVKILTANEESGDCEIKFFITITPNPDCKSLNDYKSFVRSTLQQHIKAFVISTQNTEILQMGIQPIKHISQL